MATPSGPNDRSTAPRPAASSETAPEIDLLSKIGKYEIQKKIGSGGMGSVFLALDPGLKRSVALKVLPRDKANNPTLVKRFKSEAQSAANLRHDHIVMVYEAGEADGLLYIALEYVWGTDVADIVARRGVMPVKRSLEIVRQMGLALEHAHAQGIVHRDIKPANILIRRDGAAKLADLGLARAVDDHSDTSITRAGTTVGTVDYMAPEQARDSKAADVRSDIYSLGCTWYFMLTGEVPFPDGSMTNKLRNHAETPLPDPRLVNPKVTEAIFAVIRRMTEKSPRRRYQTPAELLADLETASAASDHVSEAILGDSDDDRLPVTKRKPPRKDTPDPDRDGAPPQPRAAVSDGAESAQSHPAWKPPREDRDHERQSSDLGRAISFYAIIILLVGGVLVGAGWMVQQFSSAVDGPDKRVQGNPFLGNEPAADPNAAAGAANALEGGGSGIHGAAPTVDDRTRSVTGTAATPGQAIAGDADSRQIGGAGEHPQSRTIDGSAPHRGPTTISGSATEKAVASLTEAGPKEGGFDPNRAAGGGSRTPGRRSLSPAAAAAAEKRRGHENSLLPPWSAPVATPLESPQNPPVVVRRGVSEPGKLSSLNAALEKLPAGGGTIVLEGGGPFPLSPIRIAGKGRIVIRSENNPATGEPPLVVLISGDGPRASAVLDVIDTSLVLQNVHLASSAAPAEPAPADRALLRMQGGDLTLRECSLTAIGADGPAISAIQLSGPAPLRVLVDQTVIRGDNLTSLDVEAPALDLVCRQSLLDSGQAPALRVAGASATGARPRTLRFASTTVCSEAGAVRLAGDAEHPASTALEWIHSLVTAPEGAPSPALVTLEGWNARQQQEALGKALTWKSVDSLYLGWKPLLRLEPGGAAAAADAGEWLRAWNDNSAAGSAQFQPLAWPRAESPAKDSRSRARDSQLDRYAPESIGTAFVKTADGGWPGCSPELLVVAPLAALDVPFAAANRPQIPAGFVGGPGVGPASTEIIRVDLTKDDLGKTLAERELTTGAQIVASGFGARQSSPIVIRNAWVRLRFEQTDGAPLVLSPRGVDPGRTNDGPSAADGFIVVRNGGLEITGGAITIPAGERAQLPRWIVQAVDSDLALRNCRIQGPLFASSRNKGLVQWLRGSGRAPERPFAGSLEGYLALENCCLFGSDTLIEADWHKRAAFVRNCLLVSRDDLLTLNLRGDDGVIDATLDLETSTLSAAGSFFKVAAAASDRPAGAPLTVFADRCVFAPPLHPGGQSPEPTLVALSGPAIAARQFVWFENHCGYAPDITSFLRDESAPIQPQEFGSAWLKQWGPAQIIEPLTGPQGVVLSKELPQRTEDRVKLEPGDFALYPSSQAATWDGGQRPIGAPLAELQFPPIRASSGSAPAKPKTAKPAKSAPKQKPAKPAF